MITTKLVLQKMAQKLTENHNKQMANDYLTLKVNPNIETAKSFFKKYSL